MPDWEIREGDCLALMASMEPGSVDCCVTSPPYFGLRDYQNPGQIGLEPTPAEYVARLVAVGEGRRFVGLELNPDYACMARRRIANTQPPLFAE